MHSPTQTGTTRCPSRCKSVKLVDAEQAKDGTIELKSTEAPPVNPVGHRREDPRGYMRRERQTEKRGGESKLELTGRQASQRVSTTWHQDHTRNVTNHQSSLTCVIPHSVIDVHHCKTTTNNRTQFQRENLPVEQNPALQHYSLLPNHQKWHKLVDDPILSQDSNSEQTDDIFIYGKE